MRYRRTRSARLAALTSALAILMVSVVTAPAAVAQEPEMPDERLGFHKCIRGEAGPFDCNKVDLLAFLPPDEFGGGPSSGFGGPGNDVWGWTDPVTGTNWALAGRSNGTSFIDLSDPTDPVLVADLPRHETDTLWSDVKVYQDHAFVVAEGGGNGMQVFDLNRLRDIDLADAPVTVDADAHYDRFGNSHNVAINEDTGFAYAVGTTGDIAGAIQVIVDPPSSAAGTYFAAGASFGPAPSEDGFDGDIVLVNDGSDNPTEACEPLVDFPAGAIALIDRGNCSFVIKVNNAQDAGAGAVIVANNEPGAPFNMGGTDPDITITSVMVSLDDGNTIKAGLPATGTVLGDPEAGNPCRTGLHIVDIQDPLDPEFAGCFDEDGGTHDVQCVIYHGPDERYQGREICFASNPGSGENDTLTVVDVTDKDDMVILSRTYEGAPSAFSHQGWLTDDHRYFLHNDESDNMLNQAPGRTRARVFDVQDLEDVSVQAVHHSLTQASAHNIYVQGRFAYLTNYTDGLHVADIRQIDNPGDEEAPETPGFLDHQGVVEIACFDTDPTRSDIPGFGGSWSNYPFFDRSIVLVHGFDGFFVLRTQIGAGRGGGPDGEPSGPRDGCFPK